MVKENLTELNRSLKQAFSDVARDMNKLRDRDEKLRNEIAKIAKELNQKIEHGDLDALADRLDKSMQNVATKNELKKSETEIRSVIEKATSIPDSRAKKIEDSVKSMDDDLNQLESDIETRLKELKSKISEIDELKKELKEMDGLKKSLEDMKKQFATTKSVENNQHDIEEIYQIMDAMESSFANKDEIERVRKDVQKRLKRFEEKIKDTEDTEEELARKTKDIYDIEKGVDNVKKDLTEVKAGMKHLDNSDEIDKTNKALMKEIGKIDSRITRQSDSIRRVNNKLNSLIKAIEKNTKFPGMKTSSLEKIRKKPISKSNEKSYDEPLSDKTPSIWSKIVDWFTEEVEEEPSQKESKTSKASEKTNDNHEPKKQEKKGEEKPEKKKSFWKRTVDWLTEEIDEKE
ncbi:MAG: hypothetical protein ACLFTR_00330 [Candidatus Woesearchaeota archaeon]